MGLIEALSIYNSDRDLTTCATLSVAALSPQRLSSEVINACYNNGGNLQRLGALLRQELINGGYTPFTFDLEPGIKPSILFRNFTRFLKTQPNEMFLGGLMLTRDMERVGDIEEGHVIAILSFHKNDKVKILDTISNSRGRRTVRVQPYNSLDRRIFNNPNVELSSTGIFFLGLHEDLREMQAKSGYFEANEIKKLLASIKADSQFCIEQAITDEKQDEEQEFVERNGSHGSKRQGKNIRRLKITS